MALRITVDVFSGRPNPVVTLDDQAAAEVLERVRPSSRLDAKETEPPPPAILGYRGVIVEQVGQATRGLPGQFRIVDGKLFGQRLAHRPADPNVEDFITGPSGPLRLLPLEPEVQNRLQERIQERKEVDWRGLARKSRQARAPRARKCRCAPLYEPDWWNDGGYRQFNNNCYNYATNYRTNTFAQPGLASGEMYTSIRCTPVRKAAVADRLISTPNADNKCPDEGHLVALVVGRDFDFHWYRKGRNGYWTHKPGGTEVTDVDNSGDPIADPRNADRDGYTSFCTFMVVMHGHVKIK